MPRLDRTIADAVALDGLPRLATADDTTQHVLYLVGDVVHSMLAADWPPPLPSDPTDQERAAAIVARTQAPQQARADAAALRSAIVTVANTAVGLRIDQLNATQVRALFAIIVWESGGIANNLTVRPLGEWVKQ